ncbi:hypothetical protein HY486_03680 [Candidatus Woesearchaeota archaeon]|nr:hypothetical protein [Candidatus Woesearchaeota archaeon]
MRTVVETKKAEYVSVGDLSIGFQRTVRVPEGRINSLPAGLGRFPLYKVDDFKSGVPKEMESGYFMPMYKHEAMWMSFGREQKVPRALLIGAGMINAVSGEKLGEKLVKQNYIVVPPQPWLDGFKAEDGRIYQFVAAELGSGETVEGQITGEEKFGGIQIAVFEPKKGAKLILDETPLEHVIGGILLKEGGLSLGADTSVIFGAHLQKAYSSCLHAGGGHAKLLRACDVQRMGLGRGGEITQSIYPDPYGVEVWCDSAKEGVTLHLVSSEQFLQITGEQPPESPITIETYQSLGLPWFGLFDEHKGDVKGSAKFGKLKPVSGGKKMVEYLPVVDVPKPEMPVLCKGADLYGTAKHLVDGEVSTPEPKKKGKIMPMPKKLPQKIIALFDDEPPEHPSKWPINHDDIKYD